MILDTYSRFMSAGDFFARPDIRLRAMCRSTQKKRRANQRRRGGKKGGRKK